MYLYAEKTKVSGYKVAFTYLIWHNEFIVYKLDENAV
jgi:hypothetical protein